MNNYRLQLKDYRAISSADIELKGITVLTGENGSGKSTITKLFLVLIESITNYEYYLLEEFKELIRFKYTEFSILRKEIYRSINDPSTNLSSIFKDKLAAMQSVSDIEEVRSVYFDMVKQTASILTDRFCNIDETRYKRLLNFLELGETEKFTYEAFVEHHMNAFDDPYLQLKNKYKNPTLDNIWNIVSEHDWDNIVGAKNLRFYEDMVSVADSINNSFEQLLGVKKAIYVDTPIVLSYRYHKYGLGLWGLLNDLLYKNENVKLDLKSQKMSLRIRELIHGSLYMENPNTDEEELRYIRKEDGLNISIRETATGLKSFAYLLRLLENGVLDNRTLLILDEPEVHLHPQWIVELARIIVLLNKELGVRVLLTSHNPDMVAALQAIAKKEELENQLLFYLAEKDNNSSQYSYKNLGIDISEIFQTFNIALTRMDNYGQMDY